MPRWNELTLFAKHAQVPWPLEPTLQQAFDAFTAAFNATAKRYGGVAPVFREVWHPRRYRFGSAPCILVSRLPYLL